MKRIAILVDGSYSSTGYFSKVAETINYYTRTFGTKVHTRVSVFSNGINRILDGAPYSLITNKHHVGSNSRVIDNTYKFLTGLGFFDTTHVVIVSDFKDNGSHDYHWKDVDKYIKSRDDLKVYLVYPEASDKCASHITNGIKRPWGHKKDITTALSQVLSDSLVDIIV